VVTGVLGLGGLFLLMRWGRRLVIVAAIVAIAAQVLFHVYVAEGFHAAGLLPLALHVLAVVVACVYVPPSSNARAVVAPLAADSRGAP
jgi:hypothetical protein